MQEFQFLDCSYNGDTKNGKPHGYGTWVDPSGQKYFGKWEEGKPHGQGTWTWPSGQKYVGDWYKGNSHGEGTMTYGDGQKYVGRWKEGQEHGQGTWTWPSGQKYVGDWYKGNSHGQGVWTFPNGQKYVGDWADPEKHGQRTMTYTSREKYVRKWVTGIHQGSHSVGYQKAASVVIQKPESPKKTQALEDLQSPEDIVDFYFEIFPPGRWDSKDFTQHYKKLVREGKYHEGQVQWDRIRDVEKLGPQTRRKGKRRWNGYVIYEFAFTDNVVLECPIEGNAVYVLKGSKWKSLIQLSKGEIRDKHRKSYKKVVHKGGWIPRVERALYDL